MAATGEFLNNNIVKLELYCNDICISTATGAIVEYESASFVVSNWHVLSGRDPNSGQSMNQSLAIPDKLIFYSLSKDNEDFVWLPTVLPLIDKENGSNLWVQHSQLGQTVDIAALQLPSGTRPRYAKKIFDITGHDPNMLIDLGAELFLPGFPLGFAANGHMPIWKRASLASSLEWGNGINRCFYVDAASRSGMSGSPCFALSNWRHYSLNRETNKVAIINRPLSWRFLGIYSGRINPSDGFEAQIGVVWRENLVLDVISNGSKGSYIIGKPSVIN